MQENGTAVAAGTEAHKESKLDLGEMIDKYGNEILRMCYLYLHDQQLAEDAVQETYLKVYRNWGGYRGEALEKTWITRIAINTCISMRRKGWFREILSAGQLEQEIPVQDKYGDDTVIRSIYQLKPGLREVVIMFYYQQMKTREIADCLNISESLVSVRLNRARKRLGVMLEGWYFE